MTLLEEQVSALLKAAPGEPPMSLDPASWTQPASRTKRRWLPPVLAAAAVVVVAATTALVIAAGGGSKHVPSTPITATKPITPIPVPTDPQAAALAQARGILQKIVLPPGARKADSPPSILGRGGRTVLSSLQATASGVWLVPGTLPATVTFARTHPPAGFVTGCTCGGKVKRIDFNDDRDGPRAIDYLVAPYRNAVVIKITVIVAYTPLRPAWTNVADTATSVDVTIARIRRGGTTGGAPTVHRTLGVAATQRLAAVANRLRPEARSTCYGPIVLIQATDKLVFHEPDRTVMLRMGPGPCPQFTVEVAGHQPAYFEVGDLDTATLAELGLPAGYGGGR